MVYFPFCKHIPIGCLVYVLSYYIKNYIVFQPVMTFLFGQTNVLFLSVLISYRKVCRRPSDFKYVFVYCKLNSFL